jgi:hypothetical protein
LSLVFHGHRFKWPFLLAIVQFPIIGVGFLRHFKMMVYSAASHLVDTVSTQLLPTVSIMCSHPELAATAAKAAAVSSRPSCPNSGGGSEASPCIPDWLQPKQPAHHHFTLGQPSAHGHEEERRPFCDFLRLKLVMEPDTFLLPNMLDFSARVAE